MEYNETVNIDILLSKSVILTSVIVINNNKRSYLET